MASPGRAPLPDGDGSARISPTPAVVMNSLSQAPRGTTLVSPDTMSTPALRAASAMLSTTLRSRSRSSPSSRMKPQVRYLGRAPSMDTSLTVPCTARVPMLPPGKNSGVTVYPSVLMAMGPESSSLAASSSVRRMGLSNCSRKSSLMSRWEALPPLPQSRRSVFVITDLS